MGKKTNWTLAEDQALCRAWLHASDAAPLQTPEHRASTFWGVVHQLFHADMKATVERPVNGLKIRWTRINRDVQKFAVLHSVALAGADKGALDSAAEAQLVHVARATFEKERETKFLFEACWKLLRNSPKWMLNLSNSAGVSVSVPPPPALPEGEFLAQDPRPAHVEEQAPVALPQAETFRLPPPLPPSGLKRRAPGGPDAFPEQPGEQPSGITGALVDELRRHNELMEEQNAMALFRLDTDLVEHADARAYFALLRQRYVKKMRLAMAVADHGEGATGTDAQHQEPLDSAGRARDAAPDGADEEEKSDLVLADSERIV